MLSDQAKRELQNARSSLDKPPRPVDTRLTPAQQVDRDFRERTWHRIQTEAPEVADFISQMSKTFGRPESLRVEIEGECVIDTTKRNQS